VISRLRSIVLASFALLLGGYFLPWVMNGSAALNLNAYDLAEWASLHPAASAQTPPLLTALLLRLPLVCAGVWLAWHRAYSARMRLIDVIGISMLAIGLLPPPEFLSQIDNPNYQQQAGLAAVLIITALPGLLLSTRAGRLSRLIISLVALVIGLGAVAAGVQMAAQWMTAFKLPAEIGPGAIMMGIIFAVTAGVYLLASIKEEYSSGQPH